MFSFKRFSILIVVVFLTVSTVFAQIGGRTDLTPEELYLREVLELLIINETARSTSREQKLISLDYIGEAINNGNRNDEIRQTLEFLAHEGVRNITRENNRIVNNFPDVRRRAAVHLGTFGTPEATGTLITMLQVENEPMVIQEVIKSLGDIGNNNNNETVMNIIMTFRRFDTLNPDNLMALATIDAFEKISRSEGGLSPEAIQLLIRISEGNYVPPVKERARMLINDLRGFTR